MSQFDLDKSPVEVLLSQVTLGCIKLTIGITSSESKGRATGTKGNAGMGCARPWATPGTTGSQDRVLSRESVES